MIWKYLEQNVLSQSILIGYNIKLAESIYLARNGSQFGSTIELH